jgi:hypothetical protein
MKKNQLFFIFCFLLLVLNMRVFAQVTNPSNTWSTNAYCGWNSTNDLDFKIGVTPVLLMTLQTSGDLNINSNTNGFKIATNYVLRYNTNTSDIFVGVGAGNGTMSGHSNILVGNNAGSSLTSGEFNTALGFEALKSSTTKSTNTAIGYKSLTTLSTNAFPAASSNTAVGYQSLFNHNAYGACAFGTIPLIVIQQAAL